MVNFGATLTAMRVFIHNSKINDDTTAASMSADITFVSPAISQRRQLTASRRHFGNSREVLFGDCAQSAATTSSCMVSA